MGLILARKVGQHVQIGLSVVVRVLGVHGNVVKLAITAPVEVPIARGELLDGRDPTLNALFAGGDQPADECGGCREDIALECKCAGVDA